MVHATMAAAAAPAIDDKTIAFDDPAHKQARDLSVAVYPEQLCYSQPVFEELIEDAECIGNICDGTWLDDTAAEVWITCHFDKCGPGLHYEDILGTFTGVRTCNVLGCGAVDCTDSVNRCDVCDCSTGPCYFSVDGCDNDYLNRFYKHSPRWWARIVMIQTVDASIYTLLVIVQVLLQR